VHPLLARLTGQDLREQLAQVQHQQRLILLGQNRQISYLTEIRIRLTQMEHILTDLDTSTDNLVAVVDELITALDPATQADLLQQIAEKNREIAALQANDNADAAQIADLTGQRDQLVADAQENVAKQQEATARARAAVPTPAPPADPDLPAEPVDDGTQPV
jgi:hypothetical protein